MSRLQSKVALVVGGTSNIGAASAMRLAREGAQVMVTGRSLESAARTVEIIREQGGVAAAAAANLNDANSLSDMVDQCVKAFGGLDAIHINAADFSRTSRDTDVINIDLNIFDQVMATEMRGHMLCTRFALPALLARGGGAIIYSGSYAGVAGEVARIAYGMAKHAQIGLMRHVAKKWGKQGIRANVIAIGYVPGEGQAQRLGADGLAKVADQYWSLAKSHRMGRPEDIAAMVATLAGDDGEWINGQVISVDGGVAMR